MLSEVKKQENRKRTMAILSDKRLEYQKHKVNKLKKSRQSQVKSLNARKSLLLPFEVCQGVTVKSKLLLKPPVKKSTPSMKNSIGGKGKASAINKIFRLIAKPSHSNSTKACEKTKQSSQPSSAQVNDKTSAERNKRKKTEISLEKSRDPVTLQKRERDLSERYVELFGSATPPTPGRSIEHLILGRNKNKSMTDLISNNSTELPKASLMDYNNNPIVKSCRQAEWSPIFKLFDEDAETFGSRIPPTPGRSIAFLHSKKEVIKSNLTDKFNKLF